MQKSWKQLFFAVLALAIVFMLSGQPEKKDSTKLPSPFSEQVEQFRKADDLGGWLSVYREYVTGDAVKRIPLLDHALANTWRACRNEEERLEWFNCLATEGYYLLYSGNILRSIDAYEKAYSFYFAKPIPGADVLEYVLKPLGNNYTRLGDYDRAFLIQEKSLALAEKNAPEQIASICHNLATTAIWKEDFSLAKQFCERGLNSVTTGYSVYGLLYSTLAEVFLKTGKVDSAEINIRKAISILSPRILDKTEKNAPYWLRGAWQGLGDIEKVKINYSAALQAYQKAMQIIDQYYKGERKREKAQLLVSCGHVLLQMQQPQKAMLQYDAALKLMLASFQPKSTDDLPEANDLYGENSLLDALHGKGDCLGATGKKEKALDCYMLLYVVEKKLRNEFFSNSAKAQQQKENRQWVESAMGAAYGLWKNSGKKEWANKILLIAEMSKAQLLLDEMKNNMRNSFMKSQDSLLNKQQRLMSAIAYYEREAALNASSGDSNELTAKQDLQFELSLVQKQVKEKYPLQGGLLSDEQMPSTDTLLQHIPDNTTAVEFFVGEKNIYIIEAAKGNVKDVRRLDSADQVKQAVKNISDTYFQQGPSNMMNAPEKYYRDSYSIFHWLWPDSSYKKQEQCMIIPDGIFGYLPFEALVTDPHYVADPGQWPFLINNTDLYYSYSLQTAQQLEKLPRPNKNFAGFFVSFDSSQQSSLPAVKKEYDAIRDVVSGDFFRESEASLAAFNQSLAKVNLLHISTHSFLQGKENLPVLQLADDKFFLFELYGKAFSPQLVVLSACRTGHGMLAEGEGIISLARGFTATGAEGIVAGLWNMNDEAAAQLAATFYSRLASGDLPAAALREAKLQWLHRQKGESFQKLPYFWAGMVYSGDNRKVEVEKKNGIMRVWWLAIGVVGFLGLIFYLRKKKNRQSAISNVQ